MSTEDTVLHGIRLREDLVDRFAHKRPQLLSRTSLLSTDC